MIEEPERRPAGLQALADRHGVGLEAVRHLLRALQAGQGNMAQFDHPDLGGFGQWSRGGMVMVGSMNDHALKARVDALCTELAASLPLSGFREEGASGHWWPEELGLPSSAGAQNATRYAFFPEKRRLAVETDGCFALYDTGERIVTGASQQQGATASLRFSGPQGSFSLDDLEPAEREAEARPSAPSEPTALRHGSTGSGGDSSDILSILERLAELHRKGVLTDAEFAGKKVELLARL
ncbi:MAG: SHOCT domain-containing protein [Methylorubrum populi]